MDEQRNEKGQITLASGVKTTAEQPLTSSNLAPTPALDFRRPQDTPVFPVAQLNTNLPTLPQTQPEQQAQGFNEALQGLNAQLLGESALRAEQEQQAGLPDLFQRQTDLTNRLQTLQNEALAIPLQLQEESAGRGRTEAGLASLQASALRKNAIQALSTASLLQATQGNISTALDLVDRAVAQKYDPIRERIAVASANLDLIVNSPEFSRADKERALQQQAVQNRQEALIAREERKEKLIGDTAANLAKLGAGPQLIERIQNAQSPDEALRIASEFTSQIVREDREAERTLQSLQIRNIESQIQERRENAILRAMELSRREEEIQLKNISAAEKEKMAQKAEVESALSIKSLVDTLESSNALGLSTGLTAFTGFIPGSGTNNFRLTHKQLKDTLTRDNLDALRGLGAMSDRELRLISDSATKLSLSMSKSDYVKELGKIRENLQGTFDKALASGALSEAEFAVISGFEPNEVLQFSTLGVLPSSSSPSFNPSQFYASE